MRSIKQNNCFSLTIVLHKVQVKLHLDACLSKVRVQILSGRYESSKKQKHLVKHATATPMLLNTVLAGLLPLLILE